MKNFIVGLFVWLTGFALLAGTVYGIIHILSLLPDWVMFAGGGLFFFCVIFGDFIVDELIPAISRTGKNILEWRKSA
jgi:hypothetical protein